VHPCDVDAGAFAWLLSAQSLLWLAFVVAALVVVIGGTYTLFLSFLCRCHRSVCTCIYSCFHFRCAYHIIASSLPRLPFWRTRTQATGYS